MMMIIMIMMMSWSHFRASTFVQYDGLTQRVTRACPLRLLVLRTFSSYCLGNIRRVVCEVGFIRSVSVRNTQVRTMTEAGRHSKHSAISATQSVRRPTLLSVDQSSAVFTYWVKVLVPKIGHFGYVRLNSFGNRKSWKIHYDPIHGVGDIFTLFYFFNKWSAVFVSHFFGLFSLQYCTRFTFFVYLFSPLISP